MKERQKERGLDRLNLKLQHSSKLQQEVLESNLPVRGVPHFALVFLHISYWMSLGKHSLGTNATVDSEHLKPLVIMLPAIGDLTGAFSNIPNYIPNLLFTGFIMKVKTDNLSAYSPNLQINLSIISDTSSLFDFFVRSFQILSLLSILTPISVSGT